MSQDSLILREKTYELIEYLYPMCAKMPKFEKFTLQTQIKNESIDILKCIIKSDKSPNRKSLLYEADLHLEVLRTLIRLAFDMTQKKNHAYYINMHQYELACGKMAEVGRLLGGLIKSAQQEKG